MQREKIKDLLEGVKEGKIGVEEALEALRGLPYEDLHFAKVDHHRHLRQGLPEVIFCQGKEREQIVAIFTEMLKTGCNILATRAEKEVYEAVRATHPRAVYHSQARAITLINSAPPRQPGEVAVVTAGTSDIPVAEEACVTLEVMGHESKRIYDVGIAGIHRLLDKQKELWKARAVIVVAGMEGALASVIGGIIDRPIIAVPTSVGYGASFGGLAALLGMLNSCATGVAVVNIDNGFGAGYLASLIARG